MMMRMQRVDEQHAMEFNVRNSCDDNQQQQHQSASSLITTTTGFMMHRSSRPRGGGGPESAGPAFHHSVFGVERAAAAVAGKGAKNTTGKNGHRHTKRSPSERKFKCEQAGCERMFFTRKDVKRHMVVHTGVRNFPCQYCQQRFGRKDHLVRHAKKSHNRDCRSSASSYALASAAAAAASSATYNPQSLTATSQSSKMSRHTNNPSLLLPPVSPAPSGSMTSLNCCSNGQQQQQSSSLPSQSPQSSGQMLLLSQSQHSASGSSYPSCASVAAVGSSGSAGDFALMQHHHQVNAGDSHHLLSGSHSQSHLTVNPVQHAMAKPFDANGYHHFLPVPSAGHFVSHSLMNPFVGSSTRSLYTTPGPFSAMPAMSVDPHHAHHPHHHPHHSGPASGPAIPFPGENPALPHFNQAFH